HSNSACSINYSIAEYAQAIVRAFAEICAESALPEPDLITEAGRAMSAHHAVLITNIIDVESVSEEPPELSDPSAPQIKDLLDLWHRAGTDQPLGIYHDTQFDLQEARSLFLQGQLTLTELAHCERLAAAIFCRIKPRFDVRLRAHRDALDELSERL